MSNAQILKKAIRKAVDNGWTIPSKNYLDLIQDKDKISEETWEDIFDMMIRENSYQKFWFTHEFAKAFWGEKSQGQIREELQYALPKSIEPWKFHLQSMVLAEQPIKYLEKFLQG